MLPISSIFPLKDALLSEAIRRAREHYYFKLYYPALFRVRLDYILSVISANQLLVDELHTSLRRAWLRIAHLLSYINFDFTLPRVITCATRSVASLAWLKLL